MNRPPEVIVHGEIRLPDDAGVFHDATAGVTERHAGRRPSRTVAEETI